MGYYLVRQNNETIIGPLNLKELSDKLNTLEVTLEDEVTGNLGPWVFIESRELEDFYPEIAVKISDRSNWDLEDPTLLSKKYEAKYQQMAEGNNWKILAIAMAIGLLILAGVIHKKESQLAMRSSKPVVTKVHMSDQALIEAAEKSFDRGDYQGVAEAIKSIPVKKYADVKNDTFYKVLPYLRYVAFSGESEGVYKGVSTRELSGPSFSGFPKSCTKSDWKKVIGELQSLPNGDVSGAIFKKPLLKALLWNPSWIKRRHDSGWYYPKNLYHACLLVAKKSVESFARGDNLKEVLDRLSYQLSVVEDKKTFVEPVVGPPKTILSALSCLESGENVRCINGVNTTSALKSYFFMQNIILDVYRSMATGDAISPLYSLPRTEPVTGVDLRAESSFLEWIRRGNSPEKSKKRVQIEYPYLEL